MRTIMDVNVLDYADLKAQGTAGSASGTTFTETGAFTGVAKGETLWIQTGANAGSYLIHARTDNSVTVEPSLSTESSLEWKVTSTLTLTHRAGSESHLVDSGTAIVSTSPWILLQTGGFTNIEDGMELQVEVDGVSYYYPIVAHDDDSVSVSEFMPTGSVERPWWARTMRGVLQPGLGYDVDTLYSPGSFTGVQVGDTLWLQSGPDMGTYTITHVGTDYVRVSGQDWTALNNVRWKITAWAPFDCTAAFQAAIDAASEEGGTVYVPSGYYHFAGSLDVKRNTVLTGMWNLPPQWSEESWMEGVAQGPVLCPTDGLQDEEYGIPFITLDGSGRNAGVEGLSVYYPLQGVTEEAGTNNAILASYPWCISMASESENSSGFQRVKNVQLVNPYKGIHIDLEGTGSCHVSGVSGCPLRTGVHLERATETVYIGKIDFRPENWMGSFVDAFSNDVRMNMMGWMTGFQVQNADHVLFSDISLRMASIGMDVTTDAYSVPQPIIEATGVVFDMTNKCVHADSGSISFANASLHTTRIEGNERLVTAVGAYSAFARCAEGTGSARMSFLGGDLATNCHGIHWTSDESLNVSGVSIENILVSPPSPSYGIYADAGIAMVRGNVFPNQDSGFTETILITSGAAKGIVYGNDYHTTSVVTNEAENRNFAYVGDMAANGNITASGNLSADYDVNAGANISAGGNIGAGGNVSAGGEINAGDRIRVQRSVGNSGVILESTSAGNTPFLTFKDNSNTTAKTYSMRYDSSDEKLYIGQGDSTFTPQITVARSSGNLGVGTTSPTEKLDVNGNLKVSGDVKIASGYSLIMSDSPVPSGSSDSMGVPGQIAWDDNGIYLRTNNPTHKWLRVLVTFPF
jgi:hypothetical protein